MLAELNALDADKLSPADARLWQLLTRSLENSLGLSGFLYYDEPLSPASCLQGLQCDNSVALLSHVLEEGCGHGKSGSGLLLLIGQQGGVPLLLQRREHTGQPGSHREHAGRAERAGRR